MKWHCGLLSEKPQNDRTLAWIKKGRWDQGLPEDVERELRIWMAMPGFTAAYHAQAFGLDKRYVAKFLGGYDQSKAEVAENWLSATRDDCIRLCHLRGNGDVPVICQLSIVDDLKAGMRQAEAARVYGVGSGTIGRIRNGHIQFRGELPIGFSLLGGKTSLTFASQG